MLDTVPNRKLEWLKMAFEFEKAFLVSHLSGIAKRFGTWTNRIPGMPVIPSKWQLGGTLLALIGLGVFLRCAHVLNSNHYYMLNVDSHYFHWLAGRVMEGQGPPVPAGEADIYTLHSGLAYPLAYIAKAVGAVFGMSAPEALDATCQFLPPLLGVIGLVMMYWAGSRMFGRAGGLFSAFAWAAILHAIFHGGALGNIDRDVLNLLLLAFGLLAFYFLRKWHVHVGRFEVGWLVTAGVVLGVELLLYLEWNFIGPALLMVSLGAYFLVRLVVALFGLRKSTGRFQDKLAAAGAEVNWRAFALIVAVNVVVVAALSAQSSGWLEIAIGTVRGAGASPIGEMRGLWARGFQDIGNYHFFIIPLVFGLYLAWKGRNEAGIFAASWFVCLFLFAMFSSRILIYAVPAACLLSGLGLADMWRRGGWMWRQAVGGKLTTIGLLLANLVVAALLVVGFVALFDPGGGSLLMVVIVLMVLVGGVALYAMHRAGGWERFRPLLGRLALIDLMVLMVFFAVSASVNLQGEPIGKIAARDDWTDAMSYLEEHSEEEAVLMAWWDYGYWILDLGQRRPVVDNGYYGWDIPTLIDIKQAYLADNAAQTADIMKEYGADYLVFSAMDLDPKLAPGILSFPCEPEPVDGEFDGFPEDSLMVKVLNGEFDGGGGLNEWYRNQDVVILELDRDAGGG